MGSSGTNAKSWTTRLEITLENLRCCAINHELRRSRPRVLSRFSAFPEVLSRGSWGPLTTSSPAALRSTTEAGPGQIAMYFLTKSQLFLGVCPQASTLSIYLCPMALLYLTCTSSIFIESTRIVYTFNVNGGLFVDEFVDEFWSSILNTNGVVVNIDHLCNVVCLS